MRKGLFFTIIFLILIAMGLSYYVLFMNDKEITITFNTNSEIKTNSLVIKKGDSINLPTLERDGYIFLGWYIGEEKIDSSYKFDKTSFVNARWENINKVEVYIVSFDSEGGTVIENQTVKKGEKVVKPENPIMTGYTFVEWQLSGVAYDFNTPVTSDITLVAKWEENSTTTKTTYNITLIDRNVKPSTTSKLEFVCGAIISGLPSGYEWYDSDNGLYYRDGATMPCSDITLTAIQMQPSYKPIIYLYPEKEMDIEVKLGNIDDVTTIYPKYNNGWKVKASPDGTLINKDNGRKLYSLYWEGKNYPVKVEREGFVIKGEDTAKFLEEKLEILGLNEIESEEFIIYWLPKMEHNKYNYIRFATREKIDKYMPLEINPKPDTVIRILMEFMPLEEKINVKEQHLEKVERRGFTAIEWGGSLINQRVVK